MPVKVKEEKVVEEVFDVDVYPNIQEAMREFVEIAGCIDGDARADIEGLIVEHKLNKQYVTDLAFEVRDAKEACGAG